MDERMAALSLRRIGLAIGTTARLPYAKEPEGMVLAQDPPAHAQGIEGPSVNLLVAAPPVDTPDGFVMPDLTGLPIVSAQATLERVGLKSSPPTYEDVHVPSVGEGAAAPENPKAPGSVIGQQPPAGSRVDLASQVKLTVAR
jgi:beta-lactam-binding protein with PASTA domain